jgi:predicted tellurium resistance membrane protein TerC
MMMQLPVLAYMLKIYLGFIGVKLMAVTGYDHER